MDTKVQEEGIDRGDKEEDAQIFDSIAMKNKMEVLEVEVMPDHVHLFVSAPPRFAPSTVVNMFKGISARWLRNRFPELKQLGESLWTRTYYTGTVGSVSVETIRKYIQEQTNRCT